MDAAERVLNPQISIHALHVEGDMGRQEADNIIRKFLSTPSRRGRQAQLSALDLEIFISIHALTWRATGTAGRA